MVWLLEFDLILSLIRTLPTPAARGKQSTSYAEKRQTQILFMGLGRFVTSPSALMH